MVRKASQLLLATFACCICPLAQAEPVTYRIDPNHTDVLASWSHFGYSYPSVHFGRVSGHIAFDAEDPPRSSVEVTLPMAAISSHVDEFDEHLGSAELFDIASFPEARFRSTRVEAVADGQFRITGELTIKGITRPVVLEATLNRMGGHPATGQPTIGFNASTTVKRSGFGLGLYVPGVSDDVQIRITTEASVPLVE